MVVALLSMQDQKALFQDIVFREAGEIAGPHVITCFAWWVNTLLQNLDTF